MYNKRHFLNDTWNSRHLFVLSAVSALLLLIISYSIDMMPYAVGGELSAGQWTERAKAMCVGEDNVPDSVLLVNVSYDKQLVAYDALIDENNDLCDVRIPAGDAAAITDRSRLLEFLAVASKHDNYRYIILDVRFEEGLSATESDDSLFNLILSMKRIVIPRHRKIKLCDSKLYEKAAYGDFMNTFLESGFMKYPLVNDGELSMPAKMYCELSDSKFDAFGPFCLNNGMLCRGNMFLKFPVRFSKWIADDGTCNYYNLGLDILDGETESGIGDLIDGKIVVIGDFVGDIHSTYVGNIPGAVINLNAYIALSNGGHRIKFISVILMFIVYFAMSAVLLKRRNLFDYLPFYRRHKSGMLHFIISFIGISTVLFIFSMFFYILLDEHLNVLVPSLYFTVLATSIKSRILDIRV